ncbi:hypothetical protein [Aeromonas caviae]|uniref:hypothetical protein n=1 Tax=Aeromonas caviae TaxID=648 RepID=UPI00225A6237|nr:hypothetical protein [Aeromonas caviae]MCX4071917.1 hypothetical protein [Aeromonas caviae]
MTEIIFADNTPQEMKDEVLRLAKTWKPIRKPRLVQSNGINDADYIIAANTIYGQWKCPLYRRWSGMLARVYSPALHKQQPTYIGTQLHPDWLSFMNFRSWCLLNGWRSDYQLDKDFISDSKIYGPDTCAFIPSNVNTFIIDCSAARGDYLIGACASNDKFVCQCRDPFTKKCVTLGLYDTPEEAHLVWKKKKHEHALALAEMYPDLDPRVLAALRTKYI